MKFNEEVFYNMVRATLFDGTISADQFDGMSKILAYTQTTPIEDSRWIAYMFATVYHETAYTMQPIREYGSNSYLQSKPYYPWYGRGLVMLTWEDNYIRMGEIIGADYTTDPDVVMQWPHALDIMFEGMTHGASKTGDFTGKALKDYFNDERDDPISARAIINGTDCDKEIAHHHCLFLGAISTAILQGD